MGRHSIRNGTIKGIGTGRTELLSSYGIETAVDIRMGMGVPGIGEQFEKNPSLMAAYGESRFRFDSQKPLPTVELQKIENEVAAKEAGLLSILRQGRQRLTDLNVRYKGDLSSLSSGLAAATQAVAQAEADLAIIRQARWT